MLLTKLVNDESGVPQGSVLCPSLYSSELSSILENKLIGYADHSSMLSIVPSPRVGDRVAECLNRDLGKVSEFCYLFADKIECEYD